MKSFLIFLIIIITSCSSPYFNTYFNANKAFEAGELAYERYLLNDPEKVFTSIELKLAIDKCKKLLQDFGATDSTNAYADDAYLMIAKASYYQSDYENTIDAVNTLLEKVPNSDLKPEAYLILGQAYVDRKRFEQAQEAFAKIPLTEKFIDLIAKSKLKMADIFFDQKKYKDAEFILEEALAGNKRLVEKFEISTQTKYLLLEKLFYIYQFNENYQGLLDNGFYLLELEDIAQKLKFSDIVLFYAEEYKKYNSLKTWIGSLRNDKDLQYNSDFNEHLNLLESIINNDTLNFKEKIKQSLANTKDTYKKQNTLLLAKYLDFNTNFLDSSLTLYKNYIAIEKNPFFVKQINKRTNFIAEMANLAKKNNLLEITITSINRKIDSLSTINEDKQKIIDEKNNISVLKNKINDNNYLTAVFFYEKNNFRIAKEYFSDFINKSNDSIKIPQSYFYLAAMAINPLEKDSLYNFVYTNYESYKNNKDLMNLLKITFESDETKYDKIIDDIDLSIIKSEEFYNKISKNILPETPFKDKLEFTYITLLVNEEKNIKAIEQIIDFKNKYPKSDYLKILNKYKLAFTKSDSIVEQEKIVQMEEEKIILPLHGEIISDEIELFTPREKVYNGNPADIETTIEIDSLGHVSKVKIADEEDYKVQIQFITETWQFNKFPKDKRSFKTIFIFRLKEDDESPKRLKEDE